MRRLSVLEIQRWESLVSSSKEHRCALTSKRRGDCGPIQRVEFVRNPELKCQVFIDSECCGETSEPGTQDLRVFAIDSPSFRANDEVADVKNFL